VPELNLSRWGKVWLSKPWQLRGDPATGMIELNGVRGYLVPGDLAYLFNLAAALPDGGCYLEVGSFMGLSALVFANGLLANLNLRTTVFCVDTWEGSSEHQALPEVQEGSWREVAFHSRYPPNPLNKCHRGTGGAERLRGQALGQRALAGPPGRHPSQRPRVGAACGPVTRPATGHLPTELASRNGGPWPPMMAGWGTVVAPRRRLASWPARHPTLALIGRHNALEIVNARAV
jgi:hypothetical protein